MYFCPVAILLATSVLAVNAAFYLPCEPMCEEDARRKAAQDQREFIAEQRRLNSERAEPLRAEAKAQARTESLPWISRGENYFAMLWWFPFIAFAFCIYRCLMCDRDIRLCCKVRRRMNYKWRCDIRDILAKLLHWYCALLCYSDGHSTHSNIPQLV